MNFKEKLSELSDKLESYLKDFLQEARSDIATYTPELQDIYNLTYPLYFGGKRLRPALFIATHRMLNGNASERSEFRGAMGIQLLHTFLLIHDDIMDRAPIRYSNPTIHYGFMDKYADLNDVQHLSEGIAICMGDVVSHQGMYLLNTLSDNSEINARIAAFANKKIIDVGYGQTLDALNEHTTPSLENVLKVYELKTGRYTFELPTTAGAMLANASSLEIEQIEKYAVPAGIAYQIIDDIIGTFGDEEKTGKSSSSDIKEGKGTIMVAYAIKNGTSTQQADLRNALGNLKATDTEIAKAKQALIDTGAKDYAFNEAKRLINESNKNLNELKNVNEEYREFLQSLNDYVINRTY